MKPYPIIFAAIFLLVFQFGISNANENQFDKLLSNQRLMTVETWNQLQSHGVTKDTKLALEFFYYAPDKDSAEKCMHHLLAYEYTVQIKPEKKDTPEGIWLVTGNTQATEMTEDILLQWVDYMVAAGWKYGCVFDGWGAEIP